MTVATVRYVARVWLLLAPTATTGRMTSDDYCYCGASGTRVVATSTHNSDGLFDISGSLLLPPTIAMGSMTLGDRCYYWARGTCAVATVAYSSDESYDIR
jgi:hypothetical protein